MLHNDDDESDVEGDDNDDEATNGSHQLHGHTITGQPTKHKLNKRQRQRRKEMLTRTIDSSINYNHNHHDDTSINSIIPSTGKDKCDTLAATDGCSCHYNHNNHNDDDDHNYTVGQSAEIGKPEAHLSTKLSNQSHNHSQPHNHNHNHPKGENLYHI